MQLKVRIAFACLLVISGCALLEDYTAKTAAVRQASRSGDYAAALTALPPVGRQDRDAVLVLLERATLRHYMGEYALSAADFEKAAGIMKDLEERALVSAEAVATQAGSLFLNERVVPYAGDDFEKIFVHALDALNYLMLANLEDARVEVRRCYARQTELLHQQAADVRRAAENKDWPTYAGSDDYAVMQGKAADHSVYRNAFACYVSAYVYELNNEPDEAYVDLKQALQAAPQCRTVQQDLLRLSRRLGFVDDLEKWGELFGPGPEIPQDGIDLLVIIENGQAPIKTEVNFAVPFGEALAFFALPAYRFSVPRFRCVQIAGPQDPLKMDVLADIDAMAARNLLDKLPLLFAKQLVRASAKAAAVGRLQQEYGPVGWLLGELAAGISERADVRSWTTLPQEILVARLFLPQYIDKIKLKLQPGGLETEIAFPGAPDHVIFLGRTTDSGLVFRKKAF